MSEDQVDSARRPLKTRGKQWAQALAKALAAKKISPNFISVCSIIFAIIGSGFLAATLFVDETVLTVCLFIGAACSIQLRLLANMLDGMVAVEGGLGGPTGDIYNEFPDRLADAFFLIAAAYVAAQAQWPYGLEMGWTACTLALLTAYVRALGASIGTTHMFHGPMAKPHRMFLLTLCCLIAAGLAHLGHAANTLWLGLALMNLGMIITIWRRLSAIASALKATP